MEIAVSRANASDMRAVAQIEPDGPPDDGREEPWLASPIPAGAESYGPAVVECARRWFSAPKRPWEPMRWQEIALERQLAHVDGLLCHREALTSTARQQGKTSGGMLPLILWWLTEMCEHRGEPQTVLGVMHTLQAAEARIFFPLAPIAERLGAKIYSSFGRQSMRMPCGCEFHIQAATPSAGHSLTCDLVVVDEVWKVKPACYTHGLKPTVRSRQSPLISSWSTAGDESSEVMIGLRDQGLAAIDSGEPGPMCLTSWELPRGVDPMDERWWRCANPALGKPQSGLTLDTLRAEARDPDRAGFLRASLNMFVPTSKPWLPMGAWSRCRWPGVRRAVA